jgi:hypothetical protein
MRLTLYVVLLSILINCKMAFCLPVTFFWERVFGPNIKGYFIYYGNSSGEYNLYHRIDGKRVTRVAIDLDENHEWYAALTAYDRNGYESGYSEEIYITFDHIPPEGGIEINRGRTETFSRLVLLRLDAKDNQSGMGSGAEMKLSNDGITWTYEGPYFPYFPWILGEGAGEKIVYAIFKDVAGNWMKSPVYSCISYLTR